MAESGERTNAPCSLRASDGSALLLAALAMKTSRSQAPRNSFDGICCAFWARGKGCVRHEASRPAVVETPNTAGESGPPTDSPIVDFGIWVAIARYPNCGVFGRNPEQHRLVSLLGHSTIQRNEARTLSHFGRFGSCFPGRTRKRVSHEPRAEFRMTSHSRCR